VVAHYSGCQKVRMFNAPTFNIPLGSEVSGDDPLGLAPVNERLYGSVFPGINNVVRYIRVYSLLSWASWKFKEYLIKHPAGLSTEDVTNLYRQIHEKIELLITWSNNESGTIVGLVGTNRVFPDDDRLVNLCFEAFGSNEAAYMAAVQYRPSITNGLSFLQGAEHDTFICTHDGELLAKAVDDVLRSSSHYEWLSNITASKVRRSQVIELSPMLDLLKPSEQEKSIFLSRLIPEIDNAEDESLDANRRAGMILTLRAILSINTSNRQNKVVDIGASEAQIRAVMARGCGLDGNLLNLDGVDVTQAKWAVLQLRQYQRACYEAFYIGLEYVLSDLNNIADRSKTGVALLMGELCERAFESGKELVVKDLNQEVIKLQGEYETLYQAALVETKADVFSRRLELLDSDVEVSEEYGMPLLAHAIEGLVFCAKEVENLMLNKRMRPYLRLDEDKKSLASLPGLVSKFKDSPIREMVIHVVMRDVIDRHYEVVAMRSRNGDEKNRFRFIESDVGLRRYDDSRGLPSLNEAQDRLARALDLLEQCELLIRNDQGYILTAHGNRWT